MSNDDKDNFSGSPTGESRRDRPRAGAGWSAPPTMSGSAEPERPARTPPAPPSSAEPACELTLMPGNDLHLRLAQIYVQRTLGGGPGFDDNYVLINKRELARAYVAQNRKEIASLYLAHQYAAEHGLDPSYVEQYPEQLALNYLMGHALDLARSYVAEHRVELAEEYLLANQMDLAQSFVSEHEYDLAERCMQEFAGAVLRAAEQQRPAKSLPDMTAFLAPAAAQPASQPAKLEPVAEIPTLSMLAAGAPDPNLPAVGDDGRPARPRPRVPSRRDLQQRRAGAVRPAAAGQSIQPAAPLAPASPQQQPAAYSPAAQAPAAQAPAAQASASPQQLPAAYSPAAQAPAAHKPAEPDNPYDKPVLDAYGEPVDRYPRMQAQSPSAPPQPPAAASRPQTYQEPLSSQPAASAGPAGYQPGQPTSGYATTNQNAFTSYQSEATASSYGSAGQAGAGGYQAGQAAADGGAGSYDPDADHSDYTGPLPDKTGGHESFAFDSELAGPKHRGEHMPPPLSGSYMADKQSFNVPWETAGQVPLSGFGLSAPPSSSSDGLSGSGYMPGAFRPSSYPPGSYPPGSYPPGSYPAAAESAPPGMQQLMSGLSQTAMAAQTTPPRSLSKLGLPPPSLRSDGAAAEVTSAWF